MFENFGQKAVDHRAGFEQNPKFRRQIESIRHVRVRTFRIKTCLRSYPGKISKRNEIIKQYEEKFPSIKALTEKFVKFRYII